MGEVNCDNIAFDPSESFRLTYACAAHLSHAGGSQPMRLASSAAPSSSQVHALSSTNEKSSNSAPRSSNPRLLLCRQGEVAAHSARVRVRSGRQGDRHRQDAGAGPAGGAVYSGRDAGAAAAAATAPRTAEHTRACGLPLLHPPCTLTLAARLASHTAFCPARLPRHMTSSLHRAESDGQVLREVRDATWRQARRLGEGARLAPAAPLATATLATSTLARHLLPHACVLTHGKPRQRASPLPLHYPTRCASPSAWTATSTPWRWSRRRGRREPSSRRWRGSRGWAGPASNRTVALECL